LAKHKAAAFAPNKRTLHNCRAFSKEMSFQQSERYFSGRILLDKAISKKMLSVIFRLECKWFHLLIVHKTADILFPGVLILWG